MPAHARPASDAGAGGDDGQATTPLGASAPLFSCLLPSRVGPLLWELVTRHPPSPLLLPRHARTHLQGGEYRKAYVRTERDVPCLCVLGGRVRGLKQEGLSCGGVRTFAPTLVFFCILSPEKQPPSVARPAPAVGRPRCVRQAMPRGCRHGRRERGVRVEAGQARVHTQLLSFPWSVRRTRGVAACASGGGGRLSPSLFPPLTRGLRRARGAEVPRPTACSETTRRVTAQLGRWRPAARGGSGDPLSRMTQKEKERATLVRLPAAAPPPTLGLPYARLYSTRARARPPPFFATSLTHSRPYCLSHPPPTHAESAPFPNPTFFSLQRKKK